MLMNFLFLMKLYDCTMNMEQFVLYHCKRFDQYSDIFLISYDENNSQEKIIFRI